MTISEAIEMLQRVKEKHGDLILVRKSWDEESDMSVYDDVITERDFVIVVDSDATASKLLRSPNEYVDAGTGLFVEVESRTGHTTGHKKSLLY